MSIKNNFNSINKRVILEFEYLNFELRIFILNFEEEYRFEEANMDGLKAR